MNKRAKYRIKNVCRVPYKSYLLNLLKFWKNLDCLKINIIPSVKQIHQMEHQNHKRSHHSCSISLLHSEISRLLIPLHQTPHMCHWLPQTLPHFKTIKTTTTCSTEPAKKKKHISRPSTISTHRKCAVSQKAASLRPLSMLNKTTNNRNSRCKTIQQKVKQSKTFLAPEIYHPYNGAVHSSPSKCQQL